MKFQPQAAEALGFMVVGLWYSIVVGGWGVGEGAGTGMEQDGAGWSGRIMMESSIV